MTDFQGPKTTRTSAPLLLLLLLGLVLLTTGERCDKERADCGAEPVGVFSVFLGEPISGNSARFSGRIVARGPANLDGFSTLTLEGEAGTHVLFYRSPLDSLPVAVGESLSMEVEVSGGMPSLSALVISDAKGVRFAGASDQTPGGHVVKSGVAGFRFELRPTRCSSRPHGECYQGIYNMDLAVIPEVGDSKVLAHGQSADLAAYRVTCLTAQRVDYAPRCADAGLYGVSWTLTRMDGPTP